MLSKPKQLIDFDNQSLNSSTSTAETLSVDSYSTTSENSKEFNGLVETYHVGPRSEDLESHTLDPKEVATIERTPATIAIAGSIGTVKSRKFLKVLLDSGSTATLIRKSALPKGVQGKPLNESKGMNTLAGRLTVDKMVKLRDLRLPEFNKNMSI
jgi:hypothetical protein